MKNETKAKRSRTKQNATDKQNETKGLETVSIMGGFATCLDGDDGEWKERCLPKRFCAASDADCVAANTVQRYKRRL